MAKTKELLETLNLKALLFELRLLSFDLLLLRFYLGLLFPHSVDQDDTDAVVFDAFNLSLRVVGDQQRINLLDIFRAETQVAPPALFPGKTNWTQTAHYIKPAKEWLN